jgi:hypothetical protein
MLAATTVGLKEALLAILIAAVPPTPKHTHTLHVRAT